MDTVPIHQDTFSVPLMTTPVIDLTMSQPVSTTVQAPLPTSTATVTAITTTTYLPPPPPQPQQSTTDLILIYPIVDWAMQAPLRARFRDLPTEEACKKRRKRRDEPRSPPGSPPSQPPPPPPPAGASGAPVSDDQDSKDDHTIVATDSRKDWWKPLPEEERPTTPKPAWTILPSNVSDVKNNWASALASSYEPPAENSLLAKTGDMTTFLNWYCHQINKSKLTQADLEGQAYEVVKVFYPYIIHLQLQIGGVSQDCSQDQVGLGIIRKVMKSESMLTDHCLSVVLQMKAARYPDFGLELLVPEQTWTEDVCTYDLSAKYGIAYCVVRIKAYSRYGYDYLSEIILRRADFQEHTIAKKDFKNLYPSDFEDLNLLLLQGHLNHLSGSDKRMLSTAIKLWTRNLVIRQRVEDFQLDIESYQTQLNLTKPGWDATGYEFKHCFIHSSESQSPSRSKSRNQDSCRLIWRLKHWRIFPEPGCFVGGTLVRDMTTGFFKELNDIVIPSKRVLVIKPHNKTPYELIRGRTPLIDFMKPFGCLVPVVAGKQTNGIAGTRDYIVTGQAEKKTEPEQEFILIPFCITDPLISQATRSEFERLLQQENQTVHPNSTNSINTVSTPVSAAGPSFTNDDPSSPVNAAEPSVSTTNESEEQLFERFSPFKNAFTLPPVPNISSMDNTSIFRNAYDDEDVEEEVDMNNTLVDLPRDKWAIGTKWVFRNKKVERGIVVKKKARLVAQGHTQEEGIDYDEVFALVARIEAIRLFLAYASFKDFVVYQMDVKSAFLYEKIEDEVYVYQPPSFEDLHFPDKVYKVEKALYRLHQAPRAWYETLSTYLLDNGFHRGQIDKTLFIKRHKDDILLVQVYVDDIIFGSTKKQMSNEFETLMHDKFQMSSMGELSFFLGLQTSSTPIETNKALVKDEEAEDVDVHLYRSMIGSLMYLTDSRPDIMFVVCACARFQVTPKTSHFNVVKRIFRYLKGQPKLGLWYPRDSPFDLEAFSDSDYVGASLDKKSTTREYVAAANCCGQNPVFHSKTKHMEIRHHFIRDSYEKKLIQVIKIHTDQNVADLLTKAFDASRVKTAKDKHIEFLQIKRGRDTKIPQSCGPPKKVGDEAVHKELGDRMERVATTASSFEAEQDSVAFLEKPIESDGFAEIFDFLKASSIHYALTVNPIIYTSCIEHIWATTTVKMVNGVRQLQALVDKKRVIITESSIRSDLHLDDAEGTDYLQTATIFEEVARMG
ncbi:putative ribonuclease H-like domain-containing protein, partial [Tanacetum coccineum]